MQNQNPTTTETQSRNRDARGRFASKAPEVPGTSLNQTADHPRKSRLRDSVFTLGDKVRIGIFLAGLAVSILGFAWRIDTRLTAVEMSVTDIKLAIIGGNGVAKAAETNQKPSHEKQIAIAPQPQSQPLMFNATKIQQEAREKQQKNSF